MGPRRDNHHQPGPLGLGPAGVPGHLQHRVPLEGGRRGQRHVGVDISAGVRYLLGRKAQQESHHIRPLAFSRGMEGISLETQTWTRASTTAAGPRRKVGATNGAPASGTTSGPPKSCLARPQEAGGRVLGASRRKVARVASLGTLVVTGPAQTLLEDTATMVTTSKSPRAMAGGEQRMVGQRCGGATGPTQVTLARGCMVASAEDTSSHVH